MKTALAWAIANPFAALLAVLLVIAASIAGLQTWRLSAAENAHAADLAQWSTERVTTASHALRASEQNRQIEQRLTAQKEAAEAKHATAATERDRARRDLRRLSSELRNAAAGTGTGQVSGATCAAERERAEVLGALLGQCGSAVADMAGQLEEVNSEKRALLDAWPRIDQSEPEGN